MISTSKSTRKFTNNEYQTVLEDWFTIFAHKYKLYNERLYLLEDLDYKKRFGRRDSYHFLKAIFS